MKLTSTLSLLSIIIPSTVNGKVISLDPNNYHTLTAGKSVFIKFFAPWCGHCKAMASDYENLASAHQNDNTKLIAEVDCTAESSKPLCQQNGIKGFPTIKYGNPSALKDYQGGRDFDSLDSFVTTQLRPECSAFNLDLCSDGEKKVIEEVMMMDEEEIAKAVKKVEDVIREAEEELEQGIEGLQAKFEEMTQEHEAEVQKMKDESDYKLVSAVLQMKKAEAGIVDDEEDEEEDYYDDDDE